MGAQRESHPVSLAAPPSEPASLVRGPFGAIVLWYLWWWMYWNMIGGVLVGLGWFGSRFGVSREGGGHLVRARLLEQTIVARLPHLGVYRCSSLS